MEENAPLPKKKKPATKQQIERDLKMIYESEEEDAPVDFKTIERAKTPRLWPKLIIAAVALSVLAWITWAGIMRFGGTVRYGDNVAVGIDGPTAPRSGEVGTWVIHYENKERLPLARASLTLNIPSSITFVSAEPMPVDVKSLSWTIGSVDAGGSGSITVRGRIMDAIDAPIATQATLSYRPANFNADFQKVANWSSRISDAALSTTITGPDEAVPGDDQNFTITIATQKDISPDAVIPDLKIRFDPDQLVVIKKSEPAFSTNDAKTWFAAAPNTEKPLTYSITGAFAANATGNANVRVEVGTTTSDGRFIVLAPATLSVNILPGDLALTLIRNGSSTDSTVPMGSSLHVSIDYENKSQKTIKDAEISLTAAGTPSINGQNTIDWKSLDDLRNGKRSDGTITWTKKEIPDLSSIAPGSKGSIDISFKTVPSVFTTNDRAYKIDLSARGFIGSFGDKKSGKTVSTPVIGTLINSDAVVSAASTLTNGTLKSGETATYRVVWALQNTLHEITGIKISATLPPNVSYAGNGEVSAGDLRYDDATRTIGWSLNRLPTSIKSVSVDFNLNVTPNAGDVGKSVSLIGNSTLTATDKDTSASLASEAKALDTADADANGGNGLVQP